MNRQKVLILLAAIWLAISIPFTLIHVFAAPDDAPITPLQHAGAAVANFFGPWGVAIVRLVDFPNAGLRSFRWSAAIGLTLFGLLLFILPFRITLRGWQVLLSVAWGLFVVVWFGVGLTQIADGLL